MARDFLEEVYNLDSAEDVHRHYQEWSDTYDESVCGNGYVVPERCANALASVVEDQQAPILDFGCGTGISGVELSKAGFTEIDGCDISDGMIAQADMKDVYRRLWTVDVDEPISVEPGAYQNMSAVGVISVGAAPISKLDMLIDLLPSSGKLVFSYNDHTLQDTEYMSRINEYVDTGATRLLFKEHGEHLPGIGLEATVFVLEKA